MAFITHCLRQMAEQKAAQENYMRHTQQRERAFLTEGKKRASRSARSARSTARSNARSRVTDKIQTKTRTPHAVPVKRVKQPAPKAKSLSDVWSELRTANKAFGLFKKKDGQPMRERELLWTMMSGKKCMNYKELLQLLLKSGDKNMLSPAEIKVIKGKRNGIKKLLNMTNKEKVRSFMRKNADVSDVLVDVVSSLQKENKNRNIIDSDDDDDDNDDDDDDDDDDKDKNDVVDQSEPDEPEIDNAVNEGASEFSDFESADESEAE